MSEPRTTDKRLTFGDIFPLLTFVVPTVIIGYGFVIPASCIAGIKELTIGFATSIIAASATYVVGVRRALMR